MTMDPTTAKICRDFHLQLFNILPSLIWASGLDAKCNFFNASWLAFTGRTLEQELGDGWSDGVHPHDRSRCFKTYMEAFDARMPFDMEYRLRRHDAVYRWVLDVGRPFNDDNGEFAGYIGGCLDITENKDTEERLKQQKHILQAIFDHIPVMINFIDTTGRFKLINREWERVLGWALPEVQEQNVFNEIYPDPEQREKLFKFNRAGTGEWKDFRAKTRDGRIIDTSWVNILLADGTNIGIGQDITERKQAEEALRHERDISREYLDIAGTMILVLNADQTVRLINKKGCEILGYEEKEVIGKHWCNHFLPERERNRMNDLLKTLASGKHLEHVENPILTKNHQERMISWHNTVLKDAAGTILGTLSSGEDVTEHKRLKEELERLAKNRLLLLESTGEGIYGVDLEGRCTFVNNAAAAMLGYTPKELGGKSAHEVFHHSHPDGSPYPLDECAICRAFRTGQSCRVESEVFWRKDDTSFPVQYSSNPIIENGMTEGAVVTFSDITERKALEVQRRRLLEQVIAVQEAERERIARELHDETGQTLTSLLVGLRTIVDTDSLENARGLAQELRKLGNHALEEVQRLAHGLRPSVLDDFGLEQALKRLTQEFTQTHGILLDVHVHGLGDRRLSPTLETTIYRIVQESLTNVAKHAKASHVTVLLQRIHDSFRVIVEDDGVGFDLEEARRSNRLGLIGIEERVVSQGGSLTIESTRGKGTTTYARFNLPG